MENPSTQHPIRRLFTYLKNYRTALWSSSFYAVVNKILDLMPPILTAWIIDTVSENPPVWLQNWSGSDAKVAILILGVLTVIIFTAESFFEWLFEKGFMRLAQNVQHDLRVQGYQKMQSREVSFFENQRTGNLMSILNDDINQLERFLNTSFSEILHIITLFIFCAIALFSVSPKLAMIGLIPIPLIILSSIYYQKLIAPFYKKVRESVGELGSRLENNLAGIMVIKSFTAENYEKERVEKVSQKYRDANFSAIRYSSLYTPFIRSFVTFGFVAILMLGSFMILDKTNEITIGALAFFAMMIQRLLWPVTRLGRIFDEFERASAASRRVFGLMDADSEIKNAPDAVKPSTFAGDLTFENVSFAYKKENGILRNLSFNIPAKTTVGIAGPTGAGKTTLIKLLLRFYDVNSGAIRLDGTDLRKIDLQYLRENISFVGQDVYLFHGSIKENIAYAMPNLTDAMIVDAAKKAELHSFIESLPEGYETIVGERGIKLSGGQRQRLSIARAILKNAPLLILDEATSAVDTETERAIQVNLDALAAGKTAVVIAHRLSTIRRADKILVLDEGKLIESGSHDDLVAKEGIYAELWRIQTGAVVR